MRCDAFVQKAKEMGASDIHIVCGLNPKCRVDGKLCDLESFVMTKEMCDVVAKEICGAHYDELVRVGEFDTAGDIGGMRCRSNLFRQQGNFSTVIRLINDHIPTVEELNLPPVVKEFIGYKHGLVLITGETGSGKSTTLAAVLSEINRTMYKHILTIEDPVEYIHIPDKCVINQREVGKDTASFSNGLRAALREDPDVILIGEMRDLETIETALTAAETGHLVLGTVHTNSAADSIDRIVDVFPANRQQQIRLQLAQSLRAVLSQQLLPKAEGKGRVVCCEIMKVESSIKTLIREAKTTQIPNALITTSSIGNLPMDRALQNLLTSKTITKETYDAVLGSSGPQNMQSIATRAPVPAGRPGVGGVRSGVPGAVQRPGTAGAPVRPGATQPAAGAARPVTGAPSRPGAVPQRR